MTPVRIKTISELHKLRGLPPPAHPLISVIDYSKLDHNTETGESLMFDFYSISLKRGVGKMRYGQQPYDFDEGVMYFMAPGQILTIDPAQPPSPDRSGWILKIHPDFIWNSSLARSISQYEFFDYAVNEALFLSDKEEEILNEIVTNIQQEYHGNVDRFTQRIIISHIETLLNYADRFYQRQFVTREKSAHQLLARMETLLDQYFADQKQSATGLPSVQFLSEQLNVSKSYLASLLKSLTGLNAQQHIHEKLIRMAKSKLTTSNLTVSEIAYELGFEHSQSFSRFFKKKTNLSPLQFRAEFN
jgi:AraC-like DNA-binding protein